MNLTNKLKPFDDRSTTVGLVLLLISFSVFLFADQIGKPQDAMGTFFINYMLTATYSIYVLTFKSWVKKGSSEKRKQEYVLIAALLWLISAFTLNKEMDIFNQSSTWLCCYLITFGIAVMLSIYKDLLPTYIKHILFFVIGAGLVLFLYYSLYLFPFYIVGFLGSIALGISLHAFVPIFILAYVFVYAHKYLKTNPNLNYPFYGGIATPMLICMVFIFSWARLNNQILKLNNQQNLTESDLPSWVSIGQKMSKNWISERMLKADLVYKTFDENSNFLWGGINNNSFDAPKQHDPLVILATLFSGKPNLDEKEKIKILESMYDSRHHAQERLWSGDQLETLNLTTNVKFFPAHRLAYTEKIISIKNNGEKWWGGNQEAIYTFHLPEGGTVSSLSLWINGVEEKSILTSKSKATNAYKQIVGVENRDPSVIHWQEGNTVTVRVFPCNATENRKFKIGVTSPLVKTENVLHYQSIYFDGPVSKNANETVQISFDKMPENFKMDNNFEKFSENTWQQNRKYQPDWDMDFEAPELSKEIFSFNNQTYQIADYNPVLKKASLNKVFLDINSAWTKTEFDEVIALTKGKLVYAYDQQITLITPGNESEIFDRLSKLNFSLFPINNIKDPSNAILISKSNASSPNLKDLTESGFGKKLNEYLSVERRINFYNLSCVASPYLKTLKEFRVLNYDEGSLSKLASLMQKGVFIKSLENEDQIIIDVSGVIIKKASTNGQGNNNAPDHLLRLFAYNHLMKNVAKNYFTNDYINEENLREAETANIVSPVSSLIVLETVEDYKRFDIEKSKNSLENASMKSSGAVPEPHEWMLIILTVALVSYFLYKEKRFYRWN